MSFVDEQGKLLRRKIDYIEIDMDYCNNVYGESPCTATDSVKCYNTFFTCKDKQNFKKIVKTYKYINHDTPAATRVKYFPAKPLIKNVNDLPTEIKKDDTVTRRLKLELYDEPENDVGLDPYRNTRSKVQGTHWRKFLARNPNYKGRIIRYYEGYDELETSAFQMRFVGRLENIQINKGFVVIEAVDLLQKLSETEYPLNTNIYLTEIMPMMYTAANETEMTELNAQINELCRRTDYLNVTASTPLSTYDASGILTPGTNYFHLIFAFDSNDRAIAVNREFSAVEIEVGDNAAYISWTAVSGAAKYRIYRLTLLGVYEDSYETVNTNYTDTGVEGLGVLDFPLAERYFQLTTNDPTQAGNWTAFTDPIEIDVSDASEIETPVYIKLDKEIIYVPDKSSNTLTGLQRGLFDSTVSKHDENTNVLLYLNYGAGNPFAIMLHVLSKIGIGRKTLRTDSNDEIVTDQDHPIYIGDYYTNQFKTYEASWNGPNFGLNIIAKDIKLNKLFFQLVNAVDCMVWQNEEGKVDIIKHTELPSEFEHLNDSANFLKGSGSVNENQDSRYTDAVLYWNHFDPEKGIEEKDGFNRANISSDADARSEFEYNDERFDVQYCVWLNTDFENEATLISYVNTLLNNRRQRQRDAQPLFTADVEVKDSSLKVGQIVMISTNELQNADGTDIKDMAFRVVKKTPRKGKITIVFKRLFSETIALQADTGKFIITDDDHLIRTKIYK